MSSTVHIQESALSDAKSLLDLARHGDAVIIDGQGVSFRLAKQSGRTASEALAMLHSPAADVALDEDWSKDMEEIIAMRRDEPDPWA